MNQTTNPWPTPQQELLLRGALQKGPGAINAWEQWAATVDFENIDQGSQRLLPLLYQNLLDQGIQSPLMARYKGVYRRFWLSNQFLFNRTLPVLEALNKEGIKTLLFKGAGLVLGCNLNYAIRPMDDIDVLVPKEVAQNAINLIRKMGWQEKGELVANFHSTDHARMYHDGKGHYVDLHWRSLFNARTGKHETGYWKRSFHAKIEGVPVSIMGKTDQLIHTCVHGIWWSPIPPIRWIADAIILLENPETTIHWDHLIEHSEKLRVNLPLFQGLRYLKKGFNAPIPDNILQSLGLISVSVSRQEKWNYNLSIRKPMPVIGLFILQITGFLAYHQKQYPFPGFLRYLQHRWGVKYLWQVPLDGVLRLWRKIKFPIRTIS